MGVQRRAKLLAWTGDYGDDYRIGSSGSSSSDDGQGGGLLRLMICDLVLAFLWVLTFSMISIISGGSWFRKAVMYVGARFLFAWLGIATEGGLFNPHTTLAASLSGGTWGLLATLLGRVPAQVVGYVLGVKLILRTLPEYRGGPQLNVNVMVGVAVEGSLSFVAMIVYLLLKETEQSFFTKTFVSSITWLTLRGFGSVFTGGWINPGSAFGWACARGALVSTEHLLVYWFAPLASTVFGSWAYEHVVHPDNRTGRFDGAVTRWKSD